MFTLAYCTRPLDVGVNLKYDIHSIDFWQTPVPRFQKLNRIKNCVFTLFSVSQNHQVIKKNGSKLMSLSQQEKVSKYSP